MKDKNRPLILFDLNGVLVHHHFDGKSHVHTLRPGVRNLLDLKKHYDLGIYSSATERTVNFAISRLERGVGIFSKSRNSNPSRETNTPSQFDNDPNKLFVGGLPHYLSEEECMEILLPFGPLKYFTLVRDKSSGASKGYGFAIFEDASINETVIEGLNGMVMGNRTLSVRKNLPLKQEEAPSHGHTSLFDVILHREHCILASEAGLTREDAKPWDTVKPLEKYFGQDNGGVVLIDDSAHKSWPGEESCMVVLPTWAHDGSSNGVHTSNDDCEVLKKLTQIFKQIENDDYDFRTLVNLAKEEFFQEKERNIEMIDLATDSDSVELLTVFSDRGGESPQSKVAQGFTPLHYELERFAAMAAPSEEEVSYIKFLINKIDDTVRKIWPKARALIFGSQATALALPGSDLDVAIVGVGPKMSSASAGFSQREKGRIVSLLRDLVDALIEENLVSGYAEIINARIPIIKFEARLPHGNKGNIPVDISFGTETGIAAVEFIRANILELPPLRPMILFIKSALQERNLNEVFIGGLGSYALVNLVMAHLQLHGYDVILPQQMYNDGPNPVKLGQKWKDILRIPDFIPGHARQLPIDHLDNHVTLQFVREVTHHNHQSLLSHGCDLGMLLWDFLDYFGNRFEYYTSAVSVFHGGIINKGLFTQTNKPWLLAVEDPQDPGREICGGTSAIRDIQTRFRELAIDLADACEQGNGNVDNCGQFQRNVYQEKGPRSHQGGYETSKASRGLLMEDLNDGSLIASALDLILALDRGENGISARIRNAEKKYAKMKQIGKGNSTRIYAKNNKSARIDLRVRDKKIKKPKSKGKAKMINNTPSEKTTKSSPNPSKKRQSRASKAVQAQWSGKSRRRGQHFDMDCN